MTLINCAFHYADNRLSVYFSAENRLQSGDPLTSHFAGKITEISRLRDSRPGIK